MSQITYREIYAPSHFGNSYEVMAPYEMKDVLEEARHWGFNAYGDWFDAADLKHPANNPRNEYLTPQAIWDRKKTFYRIARDAGLQTSLILTPNHVFLDQIEPDLLAGMDSERIIGQLLCPSKPQARQVILDNCRWMFRELAEAGLTLDSLAGCPYDYGGCSCDLCQPWIITFGHLYAQIADIAREFFPDVKLRLIGWFWTKGEHEVFKQWADAQHPGLFISCAVHILYGETQPAASIELPEGCEPGAFVHIGYGNLASPRDVYGTWGPVAAARRIEQTVHNLESTDATGFTAYSEGVFDDVNKALLAGLSSGAFPDRLSVLAAYAERHFAAGSEKYAWANWLDGWGSPFEVDIRASRAEFDRLARSARPSWRLAQWEARVRLFEAHHEAASEGPWDDSRRQAAQRFIEERDRLYREIWGLGLVRHVLNPRFHTPEWARNMDIQSGIASGEV